ncbi:MAG: flagellar filament capping protein FliD, partial [Thermoclostridium sp.]|nr:flagellar filament capping protein FliD [Thermoclostridium sp.]
VERIPLNKLEQKKQLAEWRQDAYREFTNSLRGFKEQFFDVTRKASYLLTDNAFMSFSTKSSSDAYVTASGTASAQVSSHTVKVLQLATADKAKSASPVSKPVSGTVTSFELSGKKIRVNLDGVTREITLGNYDNIQDLVEDGSNGLQKLLNDAFGVTAEGNKINVSYSGGKVQLSTGNGATRITLQSGTQNDALASLGIASGASNGISTGSKLSALADKLQGNLTFSAGKVSFAINDTAFSFSEDDTLQKVMDTINNSTGANVTMRYDEASDRFTLTAKQTGAGDNIRIAETGGTLFAAIGIDAANPVTEQGVDAMAEIDGVTVARSTNTFTVNGLEYTLKQKHAAEQIGETISIEQDVDKVFNSIKSFVDEYNKLIDSFNTKLTEKYDRDYQPLSDEEKEALSEDEVKKWENKAKTGLLRNDSILQKLQSDMRMAMASAIEGVGISLSSIGISSKSYQDKGKLTIDEAKLKKAIREKPDEVKNLFIKQSEDVPSYTRSLTSTEKSTRYQQQGLLYRISDLVEDHISILRNNDGRKGILLEKAGMKGDASELRSSLAQDITNYNEKISEMLDKLAKKEDNYYKQFSQLETYMNKMNSQMEWLTSQLGGMS